MQPVHVDDARWDDFVRQHPRAHFLQLSAWGQLKSEFGWEALRVVLGDDAGRPIAGAQVLLRRFPLGLGQLAYIPYGPLVNWEDEAQVQALFAAIRAALRGRRIVLLKVEPGYDPDPALLRQLGFRESPQTVQPPSTIVLHLDEEDAILKRMNQMTRRNIRKSEKQEVQVRQAGREDVASFNRMLDETGERKAFGVHTDRYYARMYELFVPQGDAALLLASYAGTDLAGVFVFQVGDGAWYLAGASRNVERQRMASFGVQWAGIQWARARGAAFYDLYGIPDVPETVLEAQFQERSEGLWGVYRFKRGWGGELRRSLGAWDLPYSGPLYWLYQQGLRLRALLR